MEGRISDGIGPRRGYRLVEFLPKNNAGQVLKTGLRKRLVAPLASFH